MKRRFFLAAGSPGRVRRTTKTQVDAFTQPSPTVIECGKRCQNIFIWLKKTCLGVLE